MTSPWLEHLTFLYGDAVAPDLARRVETLVAAYAEEVPQALREPETPLTGRDALLIVYADQVQAEGEVPLRTLGHFLNQHVAGVVSGVHILPFYPWSSDDGFSVKDYLAVAPEYGTWEDIITLGRTFELMFDAVFNHLSAQSTWFAGYLAGDPGFRDFFVAIEGNPDLTAVVRPRALPLLTEFETSSGPRKLWTTFSADQVDLNISNPEVLLALTEVLLFYLTCGARFIRLDAIAYLWKTVGTPCIHLEGTHRVIQFLRTVLDHAAPRVLLITETNVPHVENLSYFGNGTNEAQMVYNFALPPLVVHSFRTGNASALTTWAKDLRLPSPKTAFFNFLASHDGIGLNPARGILSSDEIDELVRGTLRRNGLISYKHLPDGSMLPYEMNINFLDALADPIEPETDEILARKLLTAHAMMLALPGVPGIYFHSLFGSRGDRAAAESSGMPRRINRQKLQRSVLESELKTPGSLRERVHQAMRALLAVRSQETAMDPGSPAAYHAKDPRLFVVQRGENSTDSGIWCLHNVSGDTVEHVHGSATPRAVFTHGASLAGDRIQLQPHGCAWVR